MCGSGRKCFMKGGIQVPVCVSGKAVRMAVINRIIVVQNIRRISSHLQKAMAQKGFVSQMQRI